jgi:hypothetical protein
MKQRENFSAEKEQTFEMVKYVPASANTEFTYIERGNTFSGMGQTWYRIGNYVRNLYNMGNLEGGIGI